jgi:hypothetical protein
MPIRSRGFLRREGAPLPNACTDSRDLLGPGCLV